MNRDPRIALSQELEAKQTLLNQLRALAVEDPDFFTVIIDWLDATPLDAVPLGQLANRIVAFLRERREDNQAFILWRERNRHALREFGARAPADALGVKQEFEKALGPGRQADEITPLAKGRTTP
jgi:hypothetical protein